MPATPDLDRMLRGTALRGTRPRPRLTASHDHGLASHEAEVVYRGLRPLLLRITFLSATGNGRGSRG